MVRAAGRFLAAFVLRPWPVVVGDPELPEDVVAAVLETCSAIGGTFRPAESRDPDDEMVSLDPTSEPVDDCELGLLPSTGRRLETATNFFVTEAAFLSVFGGGASFLSAPDVVAVALPDEPPSPSTPSSSSE